MEYEELINQVSTSIKSILNKAIDIYAFLENKTIVCDIYEDYNFKIKSHESLRRIDKKCISILTSIILNNESLSRILDGDNINITNIEEYLNIKLDSVKELSYDKYQKYYQEDFNYLIENLCTIYFDGIYKVDLTDLTPQIMSFNITNREITNTYVVDWLTKFIKEKDGINIFFDSEEIIMESIDKELNILNPNRNEINIINSNENKLKKFGKYMNDMEFKDNPAIGREKEIRELEICLLTKNKSCILIGKSGVGKTAIIEGLVYNIINGKTSEYLSNKKILKIDISSLVSDSKYVGEFEKKIKIVIDLVLNERDTILYFDEIHNAIGAGNGENSNIDLANILKPYLDRGDIKVIGVTTEEEYDKYISKDSAFKRRFEVMNISEPNDELLFKIINSTISKFENDFGIIFIDELDIRKFIINSLIKLTSYGNRLYYNMNYNPDLSISIIDKMFAYAKYDNRNYIIIDDIICAIDNNTRLSTMAKNIIIRDLKLNINEKDKKTKTKILKFPINNK